MSTNIALTYFGMPGNGATIKEAKQDAGRKIEAALTGHYFPHIIRHGGLTTLIIRTPTDGWSYRLIDTKDEGTIYNSSGHNEDRNETIRAAYHNMAQLAGNYVGLENLLTPYQQRHLDRYYKFCAAYHNARDAGMSDHEAHTHACAVKNA